MLITKINSVSRGPQFGKANNTVNETVISAIDTIDAYTTNYCSKSDKAYNAFAVLPAMLLGCSYSSILPLLKSNNNSIKPYAAFSLISLLAYGFFNKKRADASYNAYVSGQQQAFREVLNNPKSFVRLSDEQAENVKNAVSQSGRYTVYSNDFDVIPDLGFDTHREFLKSVKEDVNSTVYTESHNSNDIAVAIQSIDDGAKKYYSKVVAGMNFLYGGLCALSASAIFALNKIYSKTGGVGFLKSASILLAALAPIAVIGKTSSSNYYANLDSVARYKAKQNYINQTDENKNVIAVCIDYIKNKGKYKQEVKAHNDAALTRNDIVNRMEFSDKQIQRAKEVQNDFKDKIFNKDRNLGVKEHKLANSFIRDFLLNGLSPLIVFPVCRLAGRRISQNSEHWLQVSAIVGFVSVVNALTAFVINRNNKQG